MWFHIGMKPLPISDASTVILVLQDEIRRSRESQYDHRLHAVLLVAQGMSWPEVGRLLGDSPRAVEYWVRAPLESAAGGGDRNRSAADTGLPRFGGQPVGWEDVWLLSSKTVGLPVPAAHS